MAITHVNAGNNLGCNGTSGNSQNITIPNGTGIQANDLIIVNICSDGTHVTNGCSVTDSVNGTGVVYSVLLEERESSSANHYQETKYFQTPKPIPDGSTIKVTPFQNPTFWSATVDIFRGATKNFDQRVVGKQSTSNGTTITSPALASNASAGSLVLSLAAGATNTSLSQSGAFTTGSVETSGRTTGIAFVLSASGSSSYQNTWTQGASNVWAGQTVSFLPSSSGGNQPPPNALRDKTATTFTGSSTSNVLTWPSNPTAGAKVLVAMNTNGTTAPTSVKDNGVSPTTFTLDKKITGATEGMWIYRADNINLPASGSYTVTAAFASSTTVTMMGQSYLNVAAGGPAGTNAGTGTSTSPSTGSAKSVIAGSLYFAAFSDNSSSSNETITLTGTGFTTIATFNNGTTNSPMATADQAGLGSQICSWALGDSVEWEDCLVAYAPVPPVLPPGLMISVPDFSTTTVPTVNQLNQLSGVVSFLVNQSVRPTWTLYCNGSFSLTANAWGQPSYNTVIFDSNGVAFSGEARIITQGFYATELCIQIEDTSTSGITFACAFQITGGANNPHINLGAQQWYGYRCSSPGTTTSPATDDAQTCSDISPFCLYPGDFVSPIFCASSNSTIETMENDGNFIGGRFAMKFTGYFMANGT